MADLDQLRKKAQDGDMESILELFRETKRQGLLKDMRLCVDKWHRAVHELERENGYLFTHLADSQGYGGEVWSLLVNTLFGGAGIPWSYRTPETKHGQGHHPPKILPLILSQVLILGKDGDCYPGPMFPSLVDPGELLKAKAAQ